MKNIPHHLLRVEELRNRPGSRDMMSKPNQRNTGEFFYLPRDPVIKDTELSSEHQLRPSCNLWWGHPSMALATSTALHQGFKHGSLGEFFSFLGKPWKTGPQLHNVATANGIQELPDFQVLLLGSCDRIMSNTNFSTISNNGRLSWLKFFFKF